MTLESQRARLRAALPSLPLLLEDEALRPYECDGLTAYRRLPLAVAIPETEAQVRELLRVCDDLHLPVVARGAGTGLSGGAMPHADGVVLSMARFNRMLALDPLARTATVQPGVRNLAISEAAAPHGLFYAPDPSSQIACTIGGNVAENSGGVHCLKYGLTLHNVLRVRALTMDGDPVEFGTLAPDAPGYDLLALMVGSEGMLAVITEVTVRLLPRPALAQVVLASFDDVGKAGEAVAAIIGAGLIPAGLEMMDRPMIAAVEDYLSGPASRAGGNAVYGRDAEAILLCESDGAPEEVAAEIEVMRGVLERAGATSLRVSASEAERLRFWAGRKAAFPAIGRLSPDYYCMDGTIPRRRLADMLRAIQQLERKYGLRCANVFHAGDGNLHPLIMYDAANPGELERTEAFGREILELSVKFGGTVTGEHGVGVEKLDSMCAQFEARELALFHRIKEAFDPVGLLNPGKAVPTLHRCAEYGAVHVHAGAMRFPELERL
jgi:glycolate oxidase